MHVLGGTIKILNVTFWPEFPLVINSTYYLSNNEEATLIHVVAY